MDRGNKDSEQIFSTSTKQNGKYAVPLKAAVASIRKYGGSKRHRKS